MITYQDIENLVERDEYMGFGYLGNSRRRHDHDRLLATAANHLGLSLDDVFLWANSRPARHFMDWWENDFQELCEQLDRKLPGLRLEVAQ